MHVRPTLAATATAVALVMTLATAMPAGATGSVGTTDEQAGLPYTRLKDGKPLWRAAPPLEGTKYNVRTTEPTWSLVTVKPTGTLNPTVALYDGKLVTEAERIATSDRDSGFETVLIDSNHRALGTYAVRVTAPTSGYKYDVEHVQADPMVPGMNVVKMKDEPDPAALLDTVLIAGKRYRFMITPDRPEITAYVSIFGSDPADPESWAQDLDDRLIAKGGTPGAPVVFDFIAPTTDHYAVALTKYGPAGTFYVQQIMLP